MKKVRWFILVLIALLVTTSIASGRGTQVFRARLTGDAEVPPVKTEAFGRAIFRTDPQQTRINYTLEVRRATDILAAAGAHIHCAGPGENGPVVVFLSGVIPGGLDGRFEFEATVTEDNIVNDACGSTIPELIQSMINGDTYVNVHSAANPGGEVRGQIEHR